MAETRAALKSHGKRVAGPVPFGYRADPTTKQLVQHPEEAVIVRDIFKLASDGARPSDIASMANLQNWLDGNGATGKWSSGRIRDLLNNPVYVGEIRRGELEQLKTISSVVERIVYNHEGVSVQITFQDDAFGSTESDEQQEV
ncbi:MAG: recombinase family protein [Aureliella sp.]